MAVPTRVLRRMLNAMVARSPRRFADLAGSDVVIVAGSGRSGTTWLQEVLNHRGDHRVVFEPFWGARVPLCERFASRQYLAPASRDPRYTEPAETILRGRFRNEWTDQYVRWGKVYRRRLIKTIRAHLLLKWLHGLFPRVPIVLLLRHPLAVVVSQLRRGWEYQPGNLFASQALVDDHLAPFTELERGCRTPFERNLLFWCIENYVPLRQFRSGEIHVSFYEGLLCDPEAELRSLHAFLGRDFDPHVLRCVAAPSALADRGATVRTGVDPIAGWREQVRPDQVERAMTVLTAFGMDRLYTEDPMPNESAPPLCSEILR